VSQTAAEVAATLEPLTDEEVARVAALLSLVVSGKDEAGDA
jgi:hypothetical protein